jgi:hypothetical protein
MAMSTPGTPKATPKPYSFLSQGMSSVEKNEPKLMMK